MMRATRIVRTAAVVLASLTPWSGGALARQDAGGARPDARAQSQAGLAIGPGETLQSINDDYNRQLLQIERQRLDRLARLAARQAPEQAAETYEMLFRLAIAYNLFTQADPAADRVLNSPGGTSPVVRFLAETIKVIAAADRGAFDESLAELRRLVGAGKAREPAAAPSAVLDTSSLLLICGAYYQRVVQGERFDVARKAFQLLEQEANNPDVKEYSRHRLRQLNLIDQPAPPIQGPDVDGKPFDLTSLKGDVVLVVFWASWCLPSAAEVAWLDQAYEANRSRGFRIVGINVDALPSSSTKLEAIMPSIRRFLLEHNVRWPNLVNGEGARDYASAYGVTEIPTNVLIGRDGKVIHLDLSRKNLADVIARAVGR
jgi:thiol-disulfide isomerase/thioredoxin